VAEHHQVTVHRRIEPGYLGVSLRWVAQVLLPSSQRGAYEPGYNLRMLPGVVLGGDDHTVGVKTGVADQQRAHLRS